MLTGLNLIDMVDRGSIWIPALIFGNSEQNTPVSVDELARSRLKHVLNVFFFILTCNIISSEHFHFISPSISIAKNGTLHRNPSSEVTESYVYSGDQNPIVLKREYDMTFSCDFDLVLYPFDTQYCFIEVRIIFIVFSRLHGC